VSEIRAIFWDVGGVLLSNAWDRTERAAALEHFRLDQEEFHARHEMVVSSFERGKISLDEYLDRTVFYRNRPFSREQFRDYMFSLSRPVPEALAFARALADSGKYFMGTINNESRELNLQRIEKFGLRNILRLFVSSCFVGLRKPDFPERDDKNFLKTTKAYFAPDADEPKFEFEPVDVSLIPPRPRKYDAVK
jgi:putative hydrolase of the HAD superfamily